MLLHLFITYAHALFLPYLSMMSPSISLQHKCTTSRSCIPSSYLCFPPLYAFFRRSALRAEFSSITKYYCYLTAFVITVATHKYDQREQNACTPSVLRASPEHGSPVMSFAHLISRAYRRSWQPGISEGRAVSRMLATSPSIPDQVVQWYEGLQWSIWTRLPLSRVAPEKIAYLSVFSPSWRIFMCENQWTLRHLLLGLNDE